MKNVLTIAMMAFTVGAFAQQKEQEVKTVQPIKKEFHKKHQFKEGKRKRTDFAFNQLELSDAQKAEIKEIKTKQRSEKMQLHKKHQAEVQSVLTADQLQKAEVLKADRKAKRAEFKVKRQQRQEQ